MYLIIDIGNSRVKYYNQEKSFFSLIELEKHLENTVKTEVFIKIISTVPDKNELELERMKQILETDKFHIKSTEVFDIKRSKIKNLYQGIGADRVAKLEAALKMHPNRDIVLMDFGTATTLTAASSSFNFSIGFISTGFKASLEAASRNGAQLPDLSNIVTELLKNPSIPKKELLSNLSQNKTEEAILQGTFLAHQGLINSWISEAKAKLENPLLICTGGLGKLFEDQFDHFIEDRELAVNCF